MVQSKEWKGKLFRNIVVVRYIVKRVERVEKLFRNLYMVRYIVKRVER